LTDSSDDIFTKIKRDLGAFGEQNKWLLDAIEEYGSVRYDEGYDDGIEAEAYDEDMRED